MKLPTRKNLRKQKPKPEAKKQEWPRRARIQAVLIKPAEEVSYVAILKNLKMQIKSENLGITVQGREGGERVARFRFRRGYW